jgi:hypothetical protein
LAILFAILDRLAWQRVKSRTAAGVGPVADPEKPSLVSTLKGDFLKISIKFALFFHATYSFAGFVSPLPALASSSAERNRP